MNKSLFNIKSDAIALYQQIEDAEGILTPEIEQALKINENELKTKSIGYVGLVKTLKSENLIIKDEISRLKSLMDRNTNTVNYLQNNLSSAMIEFGIEEIKTETTKINFRKSKSVVIDDADLIPIGWKNVVTTATPDKELIKKMLENGDIIIGAHIQENKNLQIK